MIQIFSHMPRLLRPAPPASLRYSLPKGFQMFKVTGVVLYFRIIPDTYYSLSPLNKENFIMPAIDSFSSPLSKLLCERIKKTWRGSCQSCSADPILDLARPKEDS